MVSDSYSTSCFLNSTKSFMLSIFWRRIVSMSRVFGIGLLAFPLVGEMAVPGEEPGFEPTGESLMLYSCF